MAAKPVKVYPVLGRFLMGVPRVVQIVPTKADAESLISSGAFTDNPNDADRDHDVEDWSDQDPTPPTITAAPGEKPEEVDQPANEPPSDGNDEQENG